MRLLRELCIGIPVAHVLLDNSHNPFWGSLLPHLKLRQDCYTPCSLLTAAESTAEDFSRKPQNGRSPWTDLRESVLSRLHNAANAQDQSSQAFAREGIFSAFNRNKEPKQEIAAEESNRSDGSSNEEQPYIFEKAASLAEEFREDIGSLRAMLAGWGIKLPEFRFHENNAELMRFAFTTGLATARTPSERQQAVATAAERIADSVQWLDGHEFSSAAELERWQSLLQWVKAEGVAHPVLKIEIGLASRQCQGPELDEYAEAIISQVESAMHEQFSDEAGCPEQMVVIANCAGASTMQGSYLFKLIKYVSLTLNRHYPHRLHRFYLVDLPRILRWPVKAVIALGHPSTRQKIILCNSDDPQLPRSLEAL